jgi:hypothetical protein
MRHYIFQVTVAEWPFSVRVCLVLYFTQKILDFDPSFCKMELNIMQKFWQKGIQALTHPIKNLVFWMKLNTPMKILAFCISSFQSSWYFAFCILWELNTA